MKFIVGTKQNMVQLFDEKGIVHPCTVLSATPMVVTRVKTKDSDKYAAVQVAFGEKKTRNVAKPVRKLLSSEGLSEGKSLSTLREFALPEEAAVAHNPVDKIDVSIFNEGDVIAVSGLTKSKGFQGVVKRHGFHGGRRSHGQKHSEREPGSIGATAPQRVFKGVRMAGRMGGDRVTVKNLKVIKVDAENNQIFVSGAIPGRRGTLVEIRSK